MQESQFVFDAGNLALDLVNTLPILGGVRRDLLGSPEQLDAWLHEAGVQDEGTILALSPRLQERVLMDARALREAVAGIAESLLGGTSAAEATLEVVNGILATNRFSTAVRPAGGCYERLVVSHPVEASAVLEPIAAAAIELLTEADPRRIRRCDDDTCVIWFLDTTRNGRRRWCSMARCGNRAKVAAHYRRRKADPSVGP